MSHFRMNVKHDGEMQMYYLSINELSLYFQCKFCGKAFASHAAHDSHVRRTHAKEKSDFPAIYSDFKGLYLSFMNVSSVD